MKAFLLAVAVLTAIYFWQRQQSPAPTPSVVKAPASATQSAQNSPRPVSEHNWAKHSLDRAHEVADQVRKTRQEDGQRP